MGNDDTKEFLEIEKPDIAIMSHYHLDHSRWGSEILEYSGAELYVPAGEERHVSDLDFFISQTALPYGLADEWREFIVNVNCFKPVDRFTSYDSLTAFDIGRVVMECLDTPGHSPSHKSFYFPEEKILFTGDLGIDRFGPWYGWYDCNLKDFIDALLFLRSLDVDVILTSHGGIVDHNVREAFDRCLEFFFSRERMIREKLEKGKSRNEIIDEGICYMNKSKVREPLRMFLEMWDGITFDNHMKYIEEGSLADLFPELALHTF